VPILGKPEGVAIGTEARRRAPTCIGISLGLRVPERWRDARSNAGGIDLRGRWRWLNDLRR